jgi:hypothetical protein
VYFVLPQVAVCRGKFLHHPRLGLSNFQQGAVLISFLSERIRELGEGKEEAVHHSVLCFEGVCPSGICKFPGTPLLVFPATNSPAALRIFEIALALAFSRTGTRKRIRCPLYNRIDLFFFFLDQLYKRNGISGHIIPAFCGLHFRTIS